MAVTPQVIRVASAANLQTQVNAYLATLFGASSVLVLGVGIDSRANAPFFNANFVATITTNPTGATVQAAPYQFVTFTAPIEADVLKLCNAFIAANPAFFFSQVFAIYRPDEPNPIQGVTLGLFFCSDAAAAATNWKPISSGGGGGGFGSNVVVTNAMSPYTVQSADGFLLVDTTGGPVTINFPSAATARGIWVKDTKNNFQTNNCTLVPAGADQFENVASNFVLSAAGFGRLFRSDPTLAGWFKF